MSSEIIQSVTYDNYDDFQHVNFIFSQKFISVILGLFNNEIDFRVRYSNTIYVWRLKWCVTYFLQFKATSFMWPLVIFNTYVTTTL
jgi:hypothetical protein